MAVGVILAVIAVERRIRSAWGGGMLVRNLPAALKKINQLVPRGLLPLIGSLVIIIGFVAVSTGWPAIIVLVLAALFGLIAAGDHRPGPVAGARGRAGRAAPPAGPGGARAGVRRLLRLHRRSGLPDRHVAAVLLADRPAVHHRHPDGADAPADRPVVPRARRGGAADLSADPAQRGGGDRRLDDDELLCEQCGPEHPLHRAARTHPHLAESRRFGEAGLLQPGARDL